MLTACRVPVITTHQTYLGRGAVASSYVDAYEHGLAVGRVALNVLRGASPSSIPVSSGHERTLAFDYAGLERFHISADALPPGSLLMNEPFSFLPRIPDSGLGLRHCAVRASGTDLCADNQCAQAQACPGATGGQ